MPLFGTGVDIDPLTVIVFAAGCLIAALTVLAFVPAVHQRAVRLTTRKLDAAVPPSMVELRSERNHLRSEFALSARKLEHSIEALKMKSSVLVNDLARKSRVIDRLEAELENRDSKIAALEQRERELEARESSLFGQWRDAKSEVATIADKLREAQLALDAAGVERDDVAKAWEQRQQLVDAQRAQIVGLQAQFDALREKIYSLADDLKHGDPAPGRDWFGLPRHRAVRPADGADNAGSNGGSNGNTDDTSRGSTRGAAATGKDRAALNASINAGATGSAGTGRNGTGLNGAGLNGAGYMNGAHAVGRATPPLAPE